MEEINGMPADDARALDDIATRASALLDRLSDEQLFSTVASLEVSVGTDWSRDGNTMTYKLPRDLFADAGAFRKALGKRTREARLTAFPVLAVIDPAAAAPLFAESALLRHEQSHAVSYQANLVRNMWGRWQEMMSRLPDAFPAELWLANKFRLDALTDAQIAAAPIEATMKRLGQVEGSELTRIVTVHPALQSDDARVGLFETMIAGRSRGRALSLARMFIGARHARSAEFARSFLGAFGPDDWAAIDLVIAADDRASLQGIFDELPSRIGRKPLKWDPHHADADLRPAIRAGFALGPNDASTRFARYFEAISSDAEAKIANDIWMLGAGTAVSHDGTNLRTGDGDMLDCDPGWMITAARFAKHPLLKRAAQALLQRVDVPQRKALLAEHALPAPEKEALVPAKKVAKKAAPAKAAPTKRAPAAKKAPKK